MLNHTRHIQHAERKPALMDGRAIQLLRRYHPNDWITVIRQVRAAGHLGVRDAIAFRVRNIRILHHFIGAVGRWEGEFTR